MVHPSRSFKFRRALIWTIRACGNDYKPFNPPGTQIARVGFPHGVFVDAAARRRVVTRCIADWVLRDSFPRIFIMTPDHSDFLQTDPFLSQNDPN